MKIFKRKNIRIGLAILLLYGCGGQQDTFQEFVKDGETVYIGRPEVRAIPSGENKVKFFVTINSDPKIKGGKVLNVLGEEVHKFVVDRKTLTDNTLNFEITNDKEGYQLYKVILMNEQGTYKSMTREVAVNVLGSRYVRALKTRTVVKVGVSGKGVIFDWGDTLATSYASFIAYTNTAGKAMTAEVSKKVKKEGEETINKQTIITDVKLGTMVKVHTGYRHSKDAGSFYSKPEEYKVEKPVITSISPLEGEPGSDITITGRNFHPIAKNNKVLFGTLEAVPVSTANATSRLIVTVPGKAKSGNYAVTIKVGETTIPGKTFKVLPKAKPLDRTKMKALKLTGDTGSAYGWVLPNVIDGKTSTGSTGFHNPLGITKTIIPPYTEAFSMFTIDMGVMAKLDKIKWWQRQGANSFLKARREYAEGNPQYFEIWGIAELPADNGASMATGWTRLIKDGQLKKGSVEDAKKGHEYLIDAKHPAVRYIRFVNQKSWNGAKWMHIMEIEMWGKEVK